jgi:hypothetical protein
MALLGKRKDGRFVKLAISPHRQNLRVRLSIVMFASEDGLVLSIFRNRSKNALNLVAIFRAGQR